MAFDLGRYQRRPGALLAWSDFILTRASAAYSMVPGGGLPGPPDVFGGYGEGYDAGVPFPRLYGVNEARRSVLATPAGPRTFTLIENAEEQVLASVDDLTAGDWTLLGSATLAASPEAGPDGGPCWRLTCPAFGGSPTAQLRQTFAASADNAAGVASVFYRQVSPRSGTLDEVILDDPRQHFRVDLVPSTGGTQVTTDWASVGRWVRAFGQTLDLGDPGAGSGSLRLGNRDPDQPSVFDLWLPNLVEGRCLSSPIPGAEGTIRARDVVQTEDGIDVSILNRGFRLWVYPQGTTEDNPGASTAATGAQIVISVDEENELRMVPGPGEWDLILRLDDVDRADAAITYTPRPGSPEPVMIDVHPDAGLRVWNPGGTGGTVTSFEAAVGLATGFVGAGVAWPTTGRVGLGIRGTSVDAWSGWYSEIEPIPGVFG